MRLMPSRTMLAQWTTKLTVIHLCRTSLSRAAARQTAVLLSASVERSSAFLATQRRYFAIDIVEEHSKRKRNEKYRKSHVEAVKKKIKELQDEALYPPGSFAELQFQEALIGLDFFQKLRSTDADVVNSSITMIERLVQEIALSSNETTRLKWLRRPGYYTPFFFSWKSAALQGADVVSPSDLREKVKVMSQHLPEFLYNRGLVRRITGLVLHVDQVKTKLRKLQDVSLHPVASFTAIEFTEAERCLDLLMKEQVTIAEVVNVSIGMVERLVEEFATTRNATQLKWMRECSSTYFKPLFKNWKDAALRGQFLLFSPDNLKQKLQSMSMRLPEFLYDGSCIGFIMDVVIHREAPAQAPLVAEELLHFQRQELARTGHRKLRPSVHIYSRLLHSWSVSGRPEAAEEMARLLRRMRAEGADEIESRLKSLRRARSDNAGEEAQRDEAIDIEVAPNAVTYGILLRFEIERGRLDLAEELFEQMTKERVKPDIACLSEMVFAHAKAGDPSMAEEYFQWIEHLEPTEKEERDLVCESVQHILVSYRNIVDSTCPTSKKERAVECAHSLFQRVQERLVLSAEDRRKMRGTMADIYTRAGRHDEAESLIERSERATIESTILLKALGKNCQPDRVMGILGGMLEDPSSQLSVFSFSTAIDAWAGSSRPDAVEKAYGVLRLLLEDPRCVELGMRPNTIVFSALLKVLSKSNRKDAGEKACAILDYVMAQRCSTDKPYGKVNALLVCFTLAYVACLQADDLERADAVLARMKESFTPPDAQFFNSVIKHYAEKGDRAGAERAEEILMDMRQRTDVKADVYSFTLTIDAWAKSGSPDAADKVYQIYKDMQADRIPPSLATMIRLVSFLAHTGNSEMIGRADNLLQNMETSGVPEIQPDHLLYESVLRGWLALGDVDRASHILDRSVEAYTLGKNLDSQPRAGSMDMVVRAWVKRGNLVKATFVFNKLMDLFLTKQLPVRPQLHTAEYLRESWLKSRHPEKYKNIRNLDDRIAALPKAKDPPLPPLFKEYAQSQHV